jgi:hypothetical protein
MERENSFRARCGKHSGRARHSLAQHCLLPFTSPVVYDRATRSIYRDTTGRLISNENNQQCLSRAGLHLGTMRARAKPRSCERDQSWMRRSSLDSKTIATAKSGEFVAYDRLWWSLPRRNPGIEYRANAGGRMQMKVSPEMWKPNAGPHQQCWCVN